MATNSLTNLLPFPDLERIRPCALNCVLTAAVTVVLALSVPGCQAPPPSGVDYLAPPIAPFSTLAAAGPTSYAELRQNCPGSHLDNVPRSAISDLVLMYDSSGREFRQPAGPDGFVLRVIPLGHASVPLDQPADFTIAAFPGEPDRIDTATRPVRTWRLPAPAAQRHWTHFQPLAGYIFRLDWGPVPLPTGRYLLLVRLEEHRRGRTRALCSQIAFEDNTSRSGAQPTEPAPADQ